ncbi:hypothetical protein CTI12_AA029160 [Artemisia annua]|uniref:GAF domain-containing protein n=1 Tax=Artemisia annua TaxID=35608 RepID=A0A2U1QHD8_ARTAN|nr:hypothetical protein CTI12_AA029160 [Artemisia annua]
MQSSIENMIRGFDFQRKSGSILFWKNTSPGNSWSLKLTGQLSRSNKDHEGLKNYRNACHRYGQVGPGTWAQLNCFAGQAAQTMVPQQRTKHDHDQLLGQLVVPVFSHGMLVGVIELVTLVPKEDYGPDLIQINRLLRAENLHT